MINIIDKLQYVLNVFEKQERIVEEELIYGDGSIFNNNKEFFKKIYEAAILMWNSFRKEK